MNMISIVIVDDHPMVREGLEAMLMSEDGFSVVAVVDSGSAALKACALHRPNLVLTDVRMPQMDGFALLRQIRDIYPSTKVLMLAGMPLHDEEVRAREAGASGYLPKSINQDALSNAIHKIAESPTFFATEDFQQSQNELLTKRELDILKGLARGKQREEIARELGIGLESVKTHAKNAMNKLGASNSTYAVSRAYELGILRI